MFRVTAWVFYQSPVLGVGTSTGAPPRRGGDVGEAEASER